MSGFPMARRTRAAAKPRAVEVHIEELVLHGFQPHERHRIAEAVERELAQLFSNQAPPKSIARETHRESVDGGAFRVAQGAKPEATGAQVARAVYGGLQR